MNISQVDSRLDSAAALVVEELIDKLQSGDADVEAFIAEHPDHAERLRRLLPALRVMADLSNSPDGEIRSVEGDAAEMGTLGDFRIVREIGRGGMGVVYEAEQMSLGRRVALKVLPFAATMDSRHLQRFHNEARAAACLHHGHIVPVFYVGCERGVHFYAMQLIEGQTLAAVISALRRAAGKPGALAPGVRGTPEAGAAPAAEHVPATVPHIRGLGDTVETLTRASLTTEGPRPGKDYYRKVAELGVQAAEALDYAHERGVIHRDVKPGNLMLDDHGALWVTDFGLAHLQHAEGSLTITGDLVGTLRYMSPEQALAKRVVVDHRTDVYSLGVTLYELLTLRSAFEGHDRQELLRQVAFAEPPAPRKLVPNIPSDLETIVLKAIEKNPTERYGSAQDLADDLQHWLADKPIRARRPTWRQMVMRWARRHMAVVWATVVVLVLTVVGLGAGTGLIGLAYRAEEKARIEANEQRSAALEAQEEERRQRESAVRERDRTADQLYVASLRLAQQAWGEADIEQMEKLLEAHRPPPGQKDRRGWEWYYLRGLCDPSTQTAMPPGGLSSLNSRLSWSPDGKKVFVTVLANGIHVWDTVRNKLEKEMPHLQPLDKWIIDGSWSPDGRRFAATSNGIFVCDLHTGQLESRLWIGTEDKGDVLAWNPDSRRIATIRTARHSNFIQIWDVEKKVPLLPKGYCVLPKHLQFKTHSLAWNREGKRLALGGCISSGKDNYLGAIVLWEPDGNVDPRLIKVDQGTVFGRPPVQGESPVSALAWSPDGKRLASVGEHSQLTVWDTRNGSAVLTLPGSKSVSWSPDGRFLAAPNSTRTRAVSIWDAGTGMEVRTLRGHRDIAFRVAWSPIGKRLVTGALGRELRIWDPLKPQDHSQPTGLSLPATCIDWHQQGWAFACMDGTVRLWDPAASNEVCRLELSNGAAAGPFHSLAWAPSGRYVAAGTEDSIIVWDVRNRKVVHERKAWENRQIPIRLPSGWLTARGVTSLVWTPTERYLIYVGKAGLEVWDRWHGLETHTLPIHRYPRTVGLTPNGRFAIADGGILMHVWNTETWRQEPPWQGFSSVNALAWSHDGRQLATAHEDRGIRLRDARNPADCLAVLRGHTEGVLALAWSPNGQRLASCGADRTVRIWNPANGQELIRLTCEASAVRWCPDGLRLFTAGRKGVQIWDSSPGYRSAPSVELPATEDKDKRASELYEVALGYMAAGYPREAEPKLREAIRLREALRSELPSHEANVGRLHHGTNLSRLKRLWVTLGTLLYRQGDWRGADEALAVALKSYPPDVNDWSAQYLLFAITRSRLGCKEEARKWYEKGIVHWDWKKAEVRRKLAPYRDEAAALLGLQKDAE
jgi:WD40 repeat protein/serine/threonine protein kinase